MSLSVSLFDLDSTLYKGEQGYVILDFPCFLNTHGRFDDRYVAELKGLKSEYKSGRLSRPDFALAVIDVYYRGLNGQSTYEIEQEAMLFWRSNSTSAWYRYTLELIHEMKCYPTKLVLVSGSPMDVLQHMPIWSDFDEKQRYTTTGKVEEGKFVSVLDETATDDAKQRLIEKMVFDPSVSFAFGDSDSDVPLLNAVDGRNSFVFCESEEKLRGHKVLYQTAKDKGWHILRYDDDKVMSTIRARLHQVFGQDQIS